MATVVVAVPNSLGTGVFFSSRQLLILCDSKGPLSSRAAMKHCALIFFPPLPNLIPTILCLRQISEMKV